MPLDFKKLIKVKSKDYDTERYYPKEAEVWTLNDNQTKVFVFGMSPAVDINERLCIVIKSGFFYKKGCLTTIPLCEFPYVSLEDEYLSEDIKSNADGKLFLEPGDIIDLNKYDIDSLGVVVPDDVDGHYTAFIVKYKQMVMIPKENEEYKVWTANDQRKEKLKQEQRSNQIKAKIIPFRR